MSPNRARVDAHRLFWNVGVPPPDLKVAIDDVCERHALGLDKYRCSWVTQARKDLRLQPIHLMPADSSHVSMSRSTAMTRTTPPNRGSTNFRRIVTSHRCDGHILVRYDTWLVDAYRDKTAEQSRSASE